MDIYQEIVNLVNRGDKVIPQDTRKQKLRLYAEGLKAKLRQAEFALYSLATYNDQMDESSSSTAKDDFFVSERVAFYCDAYWTFLYSALDVLAQVINQAAKLGLAEKEASFKNVENTLRTKLPGKPTQKQCTACNNSRAFKNLYAYRNCSIHRRQIYIKEEAKVVRHTAGYESTTTGPTVSVERTICDNPMQLTPSISQGRRVPKYLVATRNKILRTMTDIVRSIEPM